MSEEAIDSKSAAMTATQKKTFTRWVNYFLSERMLKVNDLFTDLKDGRVLINLLELISSKKLPKHNEAPKITMQEMENLNVALDFCVAEGLKFVGIGAIDIHQGKKTLILGLIWTIILRYQIQQGGGGSPKQELLEWVNKQIAPYEKLGIGPAEDFTKSWQDGKILAALTDSLRPGVMDCKNLKDPLRDTTKAMGVAEKEYEIPQLVDATDMVHTPDEHSNMTYISYFRDYLEKAKKNKKEVDSRGPKAGQCFAKGKGVEGGFARRPLPFTIHSRNAADQPVTGKWKQDFKVVVTGPTGTVPNELKDNEDGTYLCKYVAPVAGPYKVAIELVGDQAKGQSSGPIKGSVYALNVREPSDPTKCWAEGPGLIKSTEGKPAFFTVHTRDKDGKPVPGDNVQVDVKLVEKAPDAAGGTGEVPVDVKDNGDGTYSVRYDPAVAGKYRVNVTVADNKPIKDMPKIVVCYHDVDPKQCVARGPGVTPGEPKLGQEAPFAVIVKDKFGNNIPVGGHDVKVTVTGPSGTVPVDIKDDNSGVYQCKYTPKEAGPHVVDVRVEGGGVKDNPFRINIGTPADPSKSWAEGPGLHNAFDNRPAKFKVHALDKNGKPVAGENVEVKVVPRDGKGPEAQVNVTDNGDGTYDVAYMADKPGQYVIHTNIQGKPIKDMPKAVTVHPGVDASKSIVEGPGVTGGFTGADLPFTIKSMDKDSKPVKVGGDEYKVQVNAPDGTSFPVDVKDNGDGTYSGSYKPKMPGDYKVHVTVNKQKNPVGKSPYTAKVRNGASGKNSFAVGRGWKEAYDGIPARFTIHAKDIDGAPVVGETVRVVMKNVTPSDKKAAYAKELEGLDDYLRKKKATKIQKLEEKRRKQAQVEAKDVKGRGEPRVEEGSDIPVEVVDNGDGTYLATYTATTPGVFKAHVTVGDKREHIKDSPKDIPVYLSRPKIIYWKHTHEQQKKRLAAAEALLAKHNLSLPPDA